MSRFSIDDSWISKLTHGCWWLTCLMLLIGCSSGNPHPVNEDLAQQTLESTMESWKDGKTPDDLRDESPSVIVQDMEWSSGAKLLSYQIVGEGKAIDANLHAKVKLRISNAEGKEIEKTVTYVVGTSPALTVFRNIMK